MADDQEESHYLRCRRSVVLDLSIPSAPTRCGAEIRSNRRSPTPDRRARRCRRPAAPNGRRLDYSGAENLDGRPTPTLDRRCRRCRLPEAPNGRRLDRAAGEPAARTRCANVATPVILPHPSGRHLGFVQCLVAAPSFRAAAVKTVPIPRPDFRRPGLVKGWAAAPSRRQLTAVLGQPPAQRRDAPAPRAVGPTLSTAGNPPGGTSTCTARALRDALDG